MNIWLSILVKFIIALIVSLILQGLFGAPVWGSIIGTWVVLFAFDILVLGVFRR